MKTALTELKEPIDYLFSSIKPDNEFQQGFISGLDYVLKLIEKANLLEAEKQQIESAFMQGAKIDSEQMDDVEQTQAEQYYTKTFNK